MYEAVFLEQRGVANMRAGRLLPGSAVIGQICRMKTNTVRAESQRLVQGSGAGPEESVCTTACQWPSSYRTGHIDLPYSVSIKDKLLIWVLFGAAWWGSVTPQQQGPGIETGQVPPCRYPCAGHPVWVTLYRSLCAACMFSHCCLLTIQGHVLPLIVREHRKLFSPFMSTLWWAGDLSRVHQCQLLRAICCPCDPEKNDGLEEWWMETSLTGTMQFSRVYNCC